jgi:hypothetical protein
VSIELVLIPVGIAVYAAIKERSIARSEVSSKPEETPLDTAGKERQHNDPSEGCLQSRITDAGLLGRALEQAGAQDFEWRGPVLVAQLGGRPIRFLQGSGVFVGRFDDGSEEESRALIASVDALAGRLVQADKIDEMRTRAAQLGLVLVGEELADDGTVQLVFEEAT